MTAEELLINKLNPKILIVNNPDYTFNKIIEAMEEYASLPKWIPEGERLPTREDANEHGQVVVCYSDSSIASINYNLVGRTPLHKAWMRLKPYKP